jgi:hypothetical protein
MRTKFNVEIHKHGSLNDQILRMIANHNEGKAKLTIEYFEWFVRLQAAIWPTLSKGYNFTSYANHSTNVRTIEITEDDFASQTIRIDEIEIEETILELPKESTN